MTDGNTVNPRYSATVIHRNLWRYTEGGGARENFCSHTLTATK